MNTRFDAEIMFRAFPKIIIQQLGNKEDEVLATYVFFNAFPKDLSEIKLTMTDENIETFDVSFAYSHYERDFGQGVATQQNTTSVTNEPLNKTVTNEPLNKNVLNVKPKEMTQQEKNQRAIVDKYVKLQNENALSAKTVTSF